MGGAEAMLPAGRIQCPACGAVLNLAGSSVGTVCRCGQCKTSIRIVQRTVDDRVADWLREEQDPDDHGSDVLRLTGDMDSAATTEIGMPPIRLVSMEARGALFEFPASRMLEASFRCAIPRRCLDCGGQVHLAAHLVIYPSLNRKDMSVRAEHFAGALIMPEGQLHDLNDIALLERLPKVPNVPYPANLPMPYWVCDMCNGAGLISGQSSINSKTSKGRCRLFMKNLRYAADFMAAAGGKDDPGYKELHEHLANMTENPWDGLPRAVRHRLDGWFRLIPNERFVAYVPDRDLARTEDGVAGLVVTNLRFIHHCRGRHHEARHGEPLELRVAMGEHKGNVEVITRGWEVRHFALDRDGLHQLRHGLAAAHFCVTWR